MSSARILPVAMIGFVIGLSGCYYNHGYAPYGASPYGPGTYPMGPSGSGYNNMSPSYVPYGSPGVSPTPLTPNSTPTTPNWNPAPGTTNPARPYEPNGGGGPVPNPTDDERPFGGGAPPAASNTPASPTGFGASSSGVQLQPIEAGAASGPVIAGNDPFESPVRSVSNGATVAARPSRLQDDADGKRKPFGYDLRNYTWLRGYIDYDPQDQHWIMIYSATPDPGDRFGGSLTLADHQLLTRVKPQDHVLIEGHVESASFDQHGKPLYHIDKMVRLK